MASTATEQAASSVTTAPLRVRPLDVVATLCWRELVRFLRQRNRVFGAIGQPVLFWILFSAGLGPAFRWSAGSDEMSYSAYFFPGTIALILLFTAIFSTISIIEDRREGFLQTVLVAPVPRWTMVLGKVLGGAILAVGQGLLFLLLGFTVGIEFSLAGLVSITGFMFLVAMALTSLGFVIAWWLDSTQGFHAVMSVLLMPMWLLSGAFFPIASGWLGWLMRANPLTYGVAGMRRLLYWNSEAVADWSSQVPSLSTSVVVTLVFFGLMFALACRIAAVRTTGDLL